MNSRSPLNRRAFLSGSAKLAATSLLASRLSPSAQAASPGPEYRSAWDHSLDRTWIGAEFWSNPMQDWRIAGSRLECVKDAADRNVHLLTHQLADRPGSLDTRVRIVRTGGGALAGKGSAGFRVGILGTLKNYPELRDYRNNLWPVVPSGVDAGFTADGFMFVQRAAGSSRVKVDLKREAIDLRFSLAPNGANHTATLVAFDVPSGRELARVSVDTIKNDQLVGNVALVCNFAATSPVPDNLAKGAKKKAPAPTVNTGLGQFSFSDWRVSGDKLAVNPQQTFGPILWSQYTVSGGVMKLSAQMPPLGPRDSNTVRLQLNTGGNWKTVGEEKIHPEARTATFRVERWDATREAPYRLAYTLQQKNGASEHYWAGTIRRDPVDQETLTVADVSCNIHAIFPNVPGVQSMAKLNPDLIAFVGDQFYENCGGFGVQRAPLEPAILDYLRKWYFHGWTWRELMRDRPSLSLPDDHDVYQGNLWGEAGEGRKTTQEAGGYDLPAEWVNVVHRTQTSHHPDPYDPQPCKRGTSNYYGPLTYGRVSFAILADRQYKSGPEGKVPATGGRGDHVTDPNFDPQTADRPGLELLGAKQEQFLREWALDWRGAEMKAVISQTIFTSMATTHGGRQDVLMADYDANGWPQTPRHRALREIRKTFAVHLAGDQHLPAVVHYGIDEHRDGPVAFAGPAFNVGYPRWWEPARTGRNKKSRNPKLTGDFSDHFGNPLSVLAFKNGPYTPPEPVLDSVNAKTSGIGLVRFNKARRTITIECWSYSAEVLKPGTQMEGWPVTVNQLDNYGRKPVTQLPLLRISGVSKPVVQIWEESSGELLYGLRLNGPTFQPHAFAPGKYTVKISDPDAGKAKTLSGLEARAANSTTLEVKV